MKGFVFHLSNRTRPIRLSAVGHRVKSLRAAVSRYGVQALFSSLFVMGLIVGAACSRSFDKELLERLDFLFISNVEARLQMSAFDIFLSCFVSYFLFIFLLFLFALSAWGLFAIPLLPVAKGFSVGLSSAFIFASYKASGIGFYILIILPGVALFLFDLVRYSRDSLRFSLQFLRLCFYPDEHDFIRRSSVVSFLKRSVIAFLYSIGCAVTDMLLWVLFANHFHFS